MKTLILALTLGLFVGCAANNSSSPSAPTTTMTPSPTPTPAPYYPPGGGYTWGGGSSSPAPSPVIYVTPYTCVNHPLGGTIYTNDAYTIQFNRDCSYVFTDNTHITYGHWTPDPLPSDVVHTDSSTNYVINLTPSGAYICLPASGPQTCANYGFAGSVVAYVTGINITIVNQ